MEHFFAKQLSDLLALNNDRNPSVAMSLQCIRVLLNNGDSFLGSVRMFDKAQHPNGFQFQEGSPSDSSTTMLGILAPFAEANNTKPRWLYFGEEPNNIQQVVCSGYGLLANNILGVASAFS